MRIQAARKVCRSNLSQDAGIKFKQEGLQDCNYIVTCRAGIFVFV
jgi:hypothetical protein